MGLNMAYSELAKATRRCKATRKDGQRCQAYAVWGTELCTAHTYKHRGKASSDDRYVGKSTRAKACTCGAYSFPHRPGGGLCQWPDVPQVKSPIPAGTRSSMRGYKSKFRLLIRKYGMGL